MVLKCEFLKAFEHSLHCLLVETMGNRSTASSFTFGRTGEDHLEIIYGSIKSIESILQVTPVLQHLGKWLAVQIFIYRFILRPECVFSQKALSHKYVSWVEKWITDIDILYRHLHVY